MLEQINGRDLRKVSGLANRCGVLTTKIECLQNTKSENLYSFVSTIENLEQNRFKMLPNEVRNFYNSNKVKNSYNFINRMKSKKGIVHLKQLDFFTTSNNTIPIKFCICCHRTLPTEMFYRWNSRKDKLQHYCKDCDRNLSRKSKFEKSKRFCPNCKQILPIQEFIIDNRRRDGISLYCIKCLETFLIENGEQKKVNEIRANTEYLFDNSKILTQPTRNNKVEKDSRLKTFFKVIFNPLNLERRIKNENV